MTNINPMNVSLKKVYCTAMLTLCRHSNEQKTVRLADNLMLQSVNPRSPCHPRKSAIQTNPQRSPPKLFRSSRVINH